MKLPIGLLVAAVLLFVSGMIAEAEEPIVLSLVAGGASLATYALVLRSRLAKVGGGPRPAVGLAQLEQRLSLLEGELEAATIEIERLRAERDFDRQLLGELVPSREQA